MVMSMDEDYSSTTVEPKQNGRAKFAVIALLILSSVTAGFVGGYYGANFNKANHSSVSQGQAIVSSEGELITKIAEDVGPSVVSISVKTTTTQATFFGTRPITQESAGTGVIIDPSGIIITNRHVVPKGSTSVSVTLSDGTELEDVEIIGRTTDSDSLDVAFLKVKDKKGKDLKPAKLGDSSKVQVGSRVVAIGNALGEFQNTVTSGIISGYGRNVEADNEESSESLQNLFQTDAAINQGNSGGPLVNMNGEVIGINTAIAGGTAQGIGFAIPVGDLQGLIKSVLKDGKLQRPYLGVRYITLTEAYAKEHNLATTTGAYIVPSQRAPSIVAGSPAQKSGLQEKDIITKVNDTDINKDNTLTSVVGRYAVGDKIKLTVVRDGTSIVIEATLEAAQTD